LRTIESNIKGEKAEFLIAQIALIANWLPLIAIDCLWLPLIANDCQRLQWLSMIRNQRKKDYSDIPRYSRSFSSIRSHSEPLEAIQSHSQGSSFISNHSQLSWVILSVFSIWIYFCDSHFSVRPNYIKFDLCKCIFYTST
jgi:hypothetical protein